MGQLKINFIPTLIALILGALIGWTFYELGNSNAPLELLAGVTGTASALFLIGMMGIRNTSREITSVRVASGLFFTIVMVIDIIFACFDFSRPLFIIFNALSLLLWLYVVYLISKKQDNNLHRNY